MSKAVTVADLKSHLSEHLDAVEKGEDVVICRRNVPFARITAMPFRPKRTKLAFDRGKIKIRGDITGPAVPESDMTIITADRVILRIAVATDQLA